MLRLMGKREIGKLSIFDLVISVMIAEIAVFVIEDPDKSLISGLMPMFVLVGIQIILSYWHLKSQRARSMLEGSPSVLIQNGQLNYHEMQRQRYNLDDLLQQLREKDIASVSEVAFAILENSGKLSIFKKPMAFLPLPLIIDGVIQTEHLYKLGRDQSWLHKQLQKQAIDEPMDKILYCVLESNEQLFVQYKPKESDQS
jgi:uncharacterized membrane protein YcaP (DUF421 family)